MKILMALMGLDIGGAETHVVELCTALKNRGHEILVASNGGVYVKELEDMNIKHFRVPMHNKKLINMIKSYLLLRKIIIENKIKLVHAHARIPAFLCGLLKKELDFRFVTTAHWVFRASFPFNILTNWGEKTLAVSQDIKNYLIDNYNLDQKNIKITINGIDTNKFSYDTGCQDIIKEFNLDIKRVYIVHISRLDKDRSLCAHELLNITDELYRNNNNIRLIIVGTGDDVADINNKVESVNKNIGKQIVYLTGARVDINKFLALANIFVGVSRAALEAMATKRPVVLAGNEGYIGIFNKDNLERAIKTNFCCRDCQKMSRESLLSDIKKLLSLDQKNLNELGEYGFDIINKYYSVDRMADDALEVYESVRDQKKNIDVVISGYYGFNNNGDDTVLKSIIDDLKKNKPDIKIVVLSKKPLETSKIYGVKAIYRYNFFSIRKYIRQAKLLISGGGSLIQDVTSTHSLKYYLWIINMAIKNSISVMLYSNGIGPILRNKNKLLVKKTLNQVDLITLRDKGSYDLLSTLEVSKPPIIVTADAAFNLNLDLCKNNKGPMFGFNINKNFFVISIRSWKHNTDYFKESIAMFADYVYQKYGLIPVFVPMQPKKDTNITRKTIALMKNKSEAKYIGTNYLTSDLLALISKSEFILAMRLHTIIYAIQTCTPILGLVYDPKVKSVMDDINLSSYIDIKDLDLDKLKNLVSEILINKSRISNQIKQSAQDLRQASAENTKLALKLINKQSF